MKIAVYCGSSDEVPRSFLELGEEVCRLLASRGHSIVYGGGRVGLMGTLARGARSAGGKIEGVILDKFLEMGVGDPEVEEMAVVGDMRSRKKGLRDRAAAHLVLPGGVGTLDELFEVLSLKYIGLTKDPVVVLDHQGFFRPILEMLERMVELGFLKVPLSNLLVAASTPAEAVELLERG